MENDDKGFKYTSGDRRDNNNNRGWLGQAVGMLILVCVCVLVIIGTLTLAKMMLGY